MTKCQNFLHYFLKIFSLTEDLGTNSFEKLNCYKLIPPLRCKTVSIRDEASVKKTSVEVLASESGLVVLRVRAAVSFCPLSLLPKKADEVILRKEKLVRNYFFDLR